MTAYYNEINPFAAQWLRNLITKNLIAPGDVDERSIEDITPAGLSGYTQCHFFAGIGGWSLALRNAGWDDSRPVWTGSCPCQPFSTAGKGTGKADERHLWPAFFHLIQQCSPSVLFGEQVEAAIAHGWLDTVQTDLEGEGYAFGAFGIPAGGVGAPHIRQRLWFVGSLGHADLQSGLPKQRQSLPSGRCREVSDVAVGHGDIHTGGRNARAVPGTEGQVIRGQGTQADGPTTVCGSQSDGVGLADSIEVRQQGVGSDHSEAGRSGQDIRPTGLCHGAGRGPAHAQAPECQRQGTEVRRPTQHFADCEWVSCKDGKQRPIEPSTCPVVNGIPRTVGQQFPAIRGMARNANKNQSGRLHGYGNAIVPQVATELIKAYMECCPCR